MRAQQQALSQQAPGGMPGLLQLVGGPGASGVAPLGQGPGSNLPGGPAQSVPLGGDPLIVKFFVGGVAYSAKGK